jgi:hypothetical protein
VDFMSRGDVILDRYTYKGLSANASALSRGDEKIVGKPVRLTDRATWIGRFDSLSMAFDVLPARDVTRAIFGLGVGNVSSRFGSGGEYIHLRDELGATMTTLTQLIWEAGAAGALLAVILFALFARDALSVSSSSSEWRTFGAGWFGVAVIALCTLIYTNYIELPEVTILLAFFAGLMAEKAQQVRRVADSTHQPVWRAGSHATTHSTR